MAGICSVSLAESLRCAEAARSGIRRYFRSGRRLGSGFGLDLRGDRFGGNGLARRILGCSFSGFHFLWRWRIKDAIRQRSKRGLRWRQDLLPGVASRVEGVNLGLDLRAEFVGSA